MKVIWTMRLVMDWANQGTLSDEITSVWDCTEMAGVVFDAIMNYEVDYRRIE